VIFRNNSCIEDYSVADGGAVNIESYAGYFGCDWRELPCIFHVGSGLVMEDNFVSTKLDNELCWTYIGCPYARGGAIYAVGEASHTIHLGDDALIRNNFGKGYYAYGGALFLQGEGHNVTAGRNLRLTHNRMEAADYGLGGAVFMDRAPCRFFCDPWPWCSYICFEGQSSIVAGDGLRIEYNVANGWGGGGIYNAHSILQAGSHASISHNQVLDPDYEPFSMLGGGVAANNGGSFAFGPNLTVRNNSLITSSFWAGLYGVGLYISSDSSFVAGDNMLLASHTADGDYVNGHAALVEHRSTFVAGSHLSILNNSVPGADGTFYVSYDSTFTVGR
jgi:hypothetical protein